jgi:hypothetical protein
VVVDPPVDDELALVTRGVSRIWIGSPGKA